MKTRQRASTARRTVSLCWKSLLFIGAAACLAPVVHAQATAEATRTLNVQVGAMFSLANPGIGREASIRYGRWDSNGGGAYVTIDPMWRYGLEGSVRQVYDGTTGLHERTYEVGPRVFWPIRNVIPYGKVLYGRGVFTFPHQLGSQAFNEVAVGGGIDWGLSSTLYLRGDYEYQRWFGFQSAVKGFPGQLNPQVVSFGVAYHFR